MLGDVLKRKVCLLKNSSRNKSSANAFWIILRDIAVNEIVEYGDPVDSDTIIPLYYDILCKNLQYIPDYFKVVLPSNKQERFRVIVRNMFSSNAFHPDGLANQNSIYAYQETNEMKKGKRIVYQSRSKR